MIKLLMIEIQNLMKGKSINRLSKHKPMKHLAKMILICLSISILVPLIGSAVSNFIVRFVSYLPSIVLLSGLVILFKFVHN